MGGDKAISINNTTDYTIANVVASNFTAQFVDLYYSNRGIISGLRANDVQHGVQYWGGEVIGGVHPGTYMEDVAISNCQFKNVVAGVWGSCGDNITVTNVAVNTCSDVGIDFEGSRNCTATGCVVRGAANGGLALFAGSEHCVFSGCTVYVNRTDAACSGVWFTADANKYNLVSGCSVYVTPNAATAGGQALKTEQGNSYNVFSGNKFFGYCFLGRSTHTEFIGNSIIDGKIVLNGGYFNNISNNTLKRVEATQSANQPAAAIYLGWADATWPCKYNILNNNKIQGWSYSYTNDCWGDSESGNDFSYNHTEGNIFRRAGAGWFGRIVGNVALTDPNTNNNAQTY